MIVGITHTSISNADVLNNIDEENIITQILHVSLPCVICSPLREDTHPSFSIYLDDKYKVRFKDHANNTSGGLWDLLCAYWKCTYQEALDRVYGMKCTNTLKAKQREVKALTRIEHSKNTTIEVAIRKWRPYDFEYWSSYGISKEWLKYGDVHPISHKIITKEGKRKVLSADKYAYVFIERKEGNPSLKIYQPFNKSGFKWCSKMDHSVIGLWTKIPEFGDRVIICSSLKDALCISCQLHIPTICLQGEGYSMSKTAIDELKRRYKKVFISFDTDKAGIEYSTKLAEQTGFSNIIPNLGKSKDYSDYYKSLQDKSLFKKLKSLFT